MCCVHGLNVRVCPCRDVVPGRYLHVVPSRHLLACIFL